jgi:hypothetical protein
MKSISALILAAAVVALPAAAFAAPEIAAGATVTIKNNKASNIVAGGGSLDIGKVAGPIKVGSASLTGIANVNSLVMYDSNARVGGTVTIDGNEAKHVYAIGGTANVNSVVMGQPTGQ